MKKFLLGIFLILLIAILAECFLWMFLLFPNLNRHSDLVKETMLWIYSSYDRNVVQYLPDCAQYDPDLTYTLKPGNCNFYNREFNTSYSINSMGLRDDEASLNAPQIISLGDSYAMGWGVEQDETYTQIFESKTGLKALNAGISSYATSRELLLFRKLDRSKLKYLLIQYCVNDFAENEIFLNANNTLPNSDFEEYKEVSSQHVTRTKYWPFLYLREFIKCQYDKLGNQPLTAVPDGNPQILRAGLADEPATASYPDDRSKEQIEIDLREARVFLEILSQFDLPDSVQVVFIDIQSPLPQILPWIIEKENYESYIENMIFLNSVEIIDEYDFFALDGHIVPDAHRKIADRLIEKLHL